MSSKGEYAAKAVLHLSLKYPEIVPIHDIAERHHIPVKYLEHILRLLLRGLGASNPQGRPGG